MTPAPAGRSKGTSGYLDGAAPAAYYSCLREATCVVSMDRIQELSGRIVREFNPERVILFGSHARGDAGKYSDVDLLVIMPFEGKSYRKATEIRSKVRPGFPVDLIVRAPAELSQRLAWGDFFLREAVEEGKVLYEADHARVGGKG